VRPADPSPPTEADADAAALGAPVLPAPADSPGRAAVGTPLAPMVSGSGVGWGILAVVVTAGVAGFVVRHATLRGAVKEAQRTATRDPLTGLANRRLFDEFLGREVARSRRKAVPVALLLLDLDGFKRVNDTRGHAAGDEVLQTVATILRSRVRSSDLPTRFGGDEFAILLPECGAVDALRIGEELCRQVDDAVGPDVTASIGVAAVPEQAADGDELLAAADAALYRAKDEGRNRAVLAVAVEAVDGVDA
jgi:diguanylate cyclase (GGDEF)-like protein